MRHVLAALSAAALTLGASATAYAGYMQPGETMGLSLMSPLPEGLYLADTEDYGRSPGLVPGANVGVGVNIPVAIWSTPVSFYNTRLEMLAAFPFAHIDGGGLGRVGAITFAAGPMLAHDFGNGLTGGIAAFVRTPTPDENIAIPIDGRTITEGDFRESLKYTFKGGPFDGISVMENGAVTSALGQNYAGPVLGIAGNAAAQDDMFAGDFTIEKSFNKLTIGFTGYGNINLDNRAEQVAYDGRQRNVALGGLIAYDFGSFNVTGIVTRTVVDHAIVPGVSVGAETRGWLRVIVPVYTAPSPAAAVVAKY